jgi:tetratricopeptide (TPR) repeat protein
MRWVKTWGSLIIAIIALIISGYAIYQNNVHYQEVTKPHTQHDEIYNRLVRLDDKIERTEQNLVSLLEQTQDANESLKYLSKAKELRDQAELAWDEGHYDEADKFIREAYEVLQEILTVWVTNWALINGLIAGAVVVIGLLAYYIIVLRKHHE